MKSFPILACLLALLTLVSRSELDAQEKPKLTRAITIGVRTSDWLQIHSDGSGIVGFGAGPGSPFKAGTFDVEKVTKELKALPLEAKGEVRTHYYFSFEAERRTPEFPPPKYYTKDTKLIASLYLKAVKVTMTKDDELFERLGMPRFPKGFGELKKPADEKD